MIEFSVIFQIWTIVWGAFCFFVGLYVGTEK